VKLLVGVFVAAGMATALAQAPAPQTTQAEPPVRPSFAEWLDGVRAEALSRGIREEVVQSALADIEEPVPVVLERDRAQAEIILSIEAYLNRQLTPQRIQTGREMVQKNKATLDRVSERYGVPSRIIAGVWGMESNFGRFTGVRPTIAALATLAWDPRRARYFRAELFSALEILDHGDVDLAHLKGSWAGAMGQPQFMPSSYLQFAQDFDGDGRRDIWSTPDDVFASIANYLKGHGWIGGQPWGREVAVSKDVARRVAGTVQRRDGSCKATRDMTVALPLPEWQKLGVRALGGGPLPKSDLRGALVSGTTRHFLVYANYDALLEYNCAHSYALSVALLGDRLMSTPSASSAHAATPKPARPAHSIATRP
jgi:membrane-bound lytic murein transglycosylase B